MSLFLGSEMCYLSPYLNYLILNDIAKVNFNTNSYSSMYYPCYRHVFIPGLYDYARITPQISQTASNVAWRSMTLYAHRHRQMKSKIQFKHLIIEKHKFTQSINKI